MATLREPLESEGRLGKDDIYLVSCREISSVKAVPGTFAFATDQGVDWSGSTAVITLDACCETRAVYVGI